MIIDKGTPSDRDQWPDGVLDALKPWELGDVVRCPSLFYFADPQVPVWAATRNYTADSTGPEIVEVNEDVRPPFGLITTPTCDISEEEVKLPARPWVQVAPVLPADKGWIKKLHKGLRWPRYLLHVPDLQVEGPQTVWAADLRIEMPVEKGWLAGQERLIGFADESAKRVVRDRLAEIRGRPAFSRTLDRQLVYALERALEAELDEGGRLEGCIEHLREVCIQADSFLDPHTAFLTVLTDGDPKPELRHWFDEWSDPVRSNLAEESIQLQAVDVRNLDDMTAREYQGQTRIWSP